MKKGKRAVGELQQESGDLAAQLLEVMAEWVAVDDALTQPTPELFNRVEPGGVGRQKEHGQAMGLGSGQDGWRLVGRPVVLDEVDAPGMGIGLANLDVESGQGLLVDLSPLPEQDLAGQGVEDGGQTRLGVDAGLVDMTSGAARTLPAGTNVGAPVVGHLILKEQNDLPRLGDGLLIGGQHPLPLGAVLWVWTMHEGQRLLAAEAQPFQDLVDAGIAAPRQPLQSATHIL